MLSPDEQHLMMPAARACGNRGVAFSLVELVLVVAVIGILAAIALPMLGDISPLAKEAKSRGNAQRVADVSATLAGMGVAHVIPESMGGVEATIRLLGEGVTVAHELMTESVYSVPNLSTEEIAFAAKYLEIIYDTEELRLVYLGEGQSEPPVAMGP